MNRDRRASWSLMVLAIAGFIILALLSDGSFLRTAVLIAAPGLTIILFVLAMHRSSRVPGNDCRSDESRGCKHLGQIEGCCAPLPKAWTGMREVYVAGDLAEAGLICSALQCSNIEAEMKNEFIQQSIGGLPPSMPTYPRIMVREFQFERAAGIVMELLDRRSRIVPGEIEEEEEEEEGPQPVDPSDGYENVPVSSLLKSAVSPFLSLRVIRFLLLAGVAVVFVYVISYYIYNGNPPPLLGGGRGGFHFIRH